MWNVQVPWCIVSEIQTAASGKGQVPFVSIEVEPDYGRLLGHAFDAANVGALSASGAGMSPARPILCRSWAGATTRSHEIGTLFMYAAERG